MKSNIVLAKRAGSAVFTLSAVTRTTTTHNWKEQSALFQNRLAEKQTATGPSNEVVRAFDSQTCRLRRCLASQYLW